MSVLDLGREGGAPVDFPTVGPTIAVSMGNAHGIVVTCPDREPVVICSSSGLSRSSLSAPFDAGSMYPQ